MKITESKLRKIIRSIILEEGIVEDVFDKRKLIDTAIREFNSVINNPYLVDFDKLDAMRNEFDSFHGHGMFDKLKNLYSLSDVEIVNTNVRGNRNPEYVH